MAEITKKSVLLECLEYERGIMRLCSEEHQGRLPAKGEEDLFFDQQKKCKILEEIIQSLESEHVRRAMADWQKYVMEHGPTNMKIDGEVPEWKLPEKLKLDGGEPEMRL